VVPATPPTLAVFPAVSAFCASAFPLWPLDGTSKRIGQDSNLPKQLSSLNADPRRLSGCHVTYASQFSVDLPLAIKLLQERSVLHGHLLVVITFSPAISKKGSDGIGYPLLLTSRRHQFSLFRVMAEFY
jgi:hypothetical protein